MKGKLIKILSILLFGILLISHNLIPCYAEETQENAKVIRVGWYNTGLPQEEDIHSGAHGYDYEYLQALSQYTGWTYEYFPGTWEECLTNLENGKIDLMGFVQKTPEREKTLGFPDLQMAITGGLLVTDINSELNEASVDSLQDISVGIVKGNAYNDEFEEYRKQNNFRVTYKTYDTFAEIPLALQNKEIDAAVVTDEDKTSTEQIILKFASNNQYFVTNIKNQELLKELNEAMVQVNTYCPYLNSDLYQKYFSLNADGKPIFTSAELEFINSHPNILVMYDSGWPPIEYFDAKENVYKGISPDLFKLLSDKCGINFVYEGSTSGQVLQNLKNKDDKNVLTTISYDYSWAEQHNVYITQPFITSNVVKLGRNLNSSNPTIAINEKAYFTYLLDDELQGQKTKHYAKQLERLEAVRTGQADYTYVTEDQANYYRSIPKYSSFDVEQIVGAEQSICISITKNSDPELINIISKSLSSITHDEMTTITMANTVNAYELTFMDILYKYRGIIITLFFVLLTAAVMIHSRIKIDKEKQAAIIQANNAKSQFLSHVSHDIRTPLNAIIGITSLALEEENPVVKQDYLSKVNESGKYLLGLVNDTLDMSKIESGKLSIHYEPVNIQEIYDVVVAIIKPKAIEKNITIKVQKSEPLEKYIYIDKLRIEQILLNLLNNAIKFTPNGGTVTLTLKTTPIGHEQVLYHIDIEDTGIGMSEEFMKKLFIPFEQERNRLSIENGGTGLGLSIVKSLMDMMGGTISCVSKLDVGTKFTLEIPSSIASKEEVPTDSAIKLSVNDDLLIGKHILMAEDNSMNTLVSKKMLEHKKIITTCVTNGKEALDTFLSSAPGSFDLILMDIHMPVMNGLTATKAIRSSNHPDAKTIPIVALSANAYDEDRIECINAGMNEHVAKPIEPDNLFGILKQMLNK